MKYLHRAYEWPEKSCQQWDDELIRHYIRKMMAVKYHASGWPPHCIDPNLSEEERQASQKAHMDEAFQRYGIKLDPAKMIPNPGLRYLAKLCLNRLGLHLV